MDNLPSTHREVMKSTACNSFLLWSTQVSWYSSREATGLLTTPSIILPDTREGTLPGDPIIRFYVQRVAEQSRKGGYASGKEWEEYWNNPYKVRPRVRPETRTPFQMAVPMENSPTFKPVTRGKPDIIVT